MSEDAHGGLPSFVPAASHPPGTPLQLGIRHFDQVKAGGPGEYQYLHLLQQCLDVAAADPTPKRDRTGTGTYGVFGRQIRFDLSQGFPLLTTKRLFLKGIVGELLWMLSGSTNVKPLQEQGIHIWDEWADENGELGPVYGAQWRSWQAFAEKQVEDGVVWIDAPIDQIQTLLKNLREKPYDRGHVVSAWNVGKLDQMALRPCHCLFQFYVSKDNKLSCQLYQRSADIFLGVPFNIASYALLTHLIARDLGLGVGDFIHTFGDLHLYANHVQQGQTQVRREPRPFPKLQIEDGLNLLDLTTDHIRIEGYAPHPSIKGEVSV